MTTGPSQATEPGQAAQPGQAAEPSQAAQAGGASRSGVRGIATIAAAILLGAACTVWSTVPDLHRGWATFLLFLTVVFVVGSALRLSLAWIPLTEQTYLMGAPMRAWLRFLMFIRVPPWEEGAVITIIWLEVLHSSRPRHTAVLGAALIAYLMTVHLAESGASPATFRPQVPVLAIGACLLALGAGAGMLHATSPGAGSALFRVVAAVAVIIAAGLVLPHVTTRSRR
jgi:hypothetical protein